MGRFRKATRSQSKLRLALCGVSGSGKTWTALTLARELGERIAVIDTEHGSASLYAGEVADFDVLELDNHSPREYVAAIKEAEREGYDVIVVDSLSHAWAGVDGALEQVDKAAKKSPSGNSYTAWRDITPQHNELVNAIIGSKCHVIASMRSKTEYALVENERGKKVPQKIGMAPIQRSGMEYEFTVVGDMDLDHTLVVSKSRCSALADAVIARPGPEVARTLKAWLDDGEPLKAPGELVALYEAATTQDEIDAATAEVRRARHMLSEDALANLRGAHGEAKARLLKAAAQDNVEADPWGLAGGEAVNG